MLRKAKSRVRGPQHDRKQRFRPPPPAPRPGSKSDKMKFSSIEDAFESVLDGTDEFSNPLFDYDSGGHQQESGSHSKAQTPEESSWQYVEHPPSSAEAAGRKGKHSGSGLESSEDLDWSVDPLLGQIVSKPHSVTSNSSSLFDEDNEGVDGDSASGRPHNQPLGQVKSESRLVSSGSLFDEDERAGETVSTVEHDRNQLGASSATSLFDEDDYEREGDPEVTHHQNEGVLESEEPAMLDPDSSDRQSTHDQFTSEPEAQTIRPQEDPLLGATTTTTATTESSDQQARIEEQELYCKTGTSSDELVGNEGATFTAPVDEACKLSSSPSSRKEQTIECELEEDTQRTSVADETKASLHPRPSETKIIVTCNDLDASELVYVHPLRASSPDYHTDTILLEGGPEARTSKSSSEEPEEGKLEAESKRDTLKLEDHLILQESPLSSLPSSCESGEHFLARNPLEHPLATSAPTPTSIAMPGLPRYADARSPSVESGIGSSVEIPLPKSRPGNEHMLLFDASEHPLSPNTSYEEGLPHEDSTAGPREQRDPLDSFVKIDKNDLFPIEEDHFSKDSSVRETSYSAGRTTFSNQSSKPSRPAVPSRPRHPPTAPPRPNPPLVKKNSAGKIPPPRPSYSPKLQRRKAAASNIPPAVQETAVDLSSNQKSRSNGAITKVKLVQPLGRAPPPRVGKSRAESSPLFIASREVGSLVKDSEPSYSRSSGSSSAPDATSLLKQQGSLTAQSHTLIEADVPKPPESFTKPESKATTEAAAGVTKSDQKKEDVLFDEDDKPRHVQEEEFLPGLAIEYLLLLAGILYLYFSLNIFTYVSGFLAGLLLFYELAGGAFIYYVHNMEEGKSEEAEERSRESLSPSDEFVQSMMVNFNKLKGYQSNTFTATFQYDSSTHHPRDRYPAEVKLSNDFDFMIRVFYQQQQSHLPITKVLPMDIRECSVSLVPLEVAQNRKRRWSKKFPIKISWSRQKQHYSAFLFAHTSREKEDWFRRLRAASEGVTSEELIRKQKEFFSYMQHYIPAGSGRGSSSRSAASGRGRPKPKAPRQGRALRHKPMSSSLVSFSNRPEREEEMGAISITKASPPKQEPYATSAAVKRSLSSISSASSDLGTTADLPQQFRVQATTTKPSLQHRAPSVDGDGYVVIPRSPAISRAPKETDWINALAARLCWDIWHEKRWKDWVTSRIQRKLIRMKTPSFMEKLQLTGVELGNDMPVINRLRRGPTLDLRGVWAYLDVTYQGLFVMTIETKLKFGGKDGEEETGTEMVPVQHSHDSHSHSRSESPSHSSVPKAPSHSRAARVLSLGTPIDPEDIDSGSDEEGHTPVPYNDPEELHLQASPPSHPGDSTHDHSPQQQQQQQQQQQPSRKGRLMDVVSRLTKKVANTRIMRKAAEKVSSYPLVLTVEVQRLDGVLAINIPPPPTDTIWYGFEGTPHLKLVAKPKLGRREVTLTQVTHWIEKKLCELVKKKLVLPNMEDLVIPLLNSGLPEDEGKLSPLTSPTTPKEHSSY